MIVFILGGVKGGKSMLAQCIAQRRAADENKNLYYIATMIPRDSEDEKRIERHLLDREDWGFQTVEEGIDLTKINDKILDDSIVMLDSVTAFVQNNMFSNDGICHEINSEDLFVQIKKLSEQSRDFIIVTDYLFSDAIHYNYETELYKRVLGEVHCAIAQMSDVVIECTYSIMKFWKNDKGHDFSEILNHYYNISSHLEYKDI